MACLPQPARSGGAGRTPMCPPKQSVRGFPNLNNHLDRYSPMGQ